MVDSRGVTMQAKQNRQGKGGAGSVSVRESWLGPVLELVSAEGAVAEVALLGAQVVRWKTAGGEEVLFRPAEGEASGPVREGEEVHGGIPVCWPWFGRMGEEGARIHGLARYRRFAVRSAGGREGGTAEAVLELASDAGTREVFPYDFRLAVRVSVGDGVEVELEGENTGTEAFAVTAGFHPYLRVSRADAVRVEGLEGEAYADWFAGATGREVDGVQRGAYGPVAGSRVFAGGRRGCRVRDGGTGRVVELEAEGHTRWIVWRAERAAGRMAEAEKDGFVCVEPVVFPRCDAVVLGAGERHRMRLGMRVGEGGEDFKAGISEERTSGV